MLSGVARWQRRGLSSAGDMGAELRRQWRLWGRCPGGRERERDLHFYRQGQSEVPSRLSSAQSSLG